MIELQLHCEQRNDSALMGPPDHGLLLPGHAATRGFPHDAVSTCMGHLGISPSGYSNWERSGSRGVVRAAQHSTAWRGWFVCIYKL